MRACVFCLDKGQLGPVLTIISDQGLTKAALHIMYHMKLRAVWFAGINHQDHNCDNGVLPAIGLRHLSGKALFINRLHRGPKKNPGHWHGKILTAMRQFLRKFCLGDPAMVRLWAGYVGRICQDLGLPLGAENQALDICSKLARRKGPQGESIRWMSSYDASEFNTRHRHCRMFLVDLALMAEGGHPYNIRGIDFMDSLDDVFKKEVHTLAAAAHILRDDVLWKVSIHN